ncbi:MAG: hypothetical protein KIT63_23815 [Rhodoferax sp.]|nr:hypothetical protein [Rhodoferax sp.]
MMENVVERIETNKAEELDRDEAALNQQLTEARAKVRELRTPPDYRALLDADLSQQAEAELERWTARAGRLAAGITALQAERVAYFEQLDREAVQERVQKIQALGDSKSEIARKLQEALVSAAAHINMLAAKDQDILELLDYQNVNPSVLTPAGWEVVDTVHHLRDWEFSKTLALEELGRLLNGRTTGELVANIDGFGARVEQQWATWFYHRRQADRKRAEELAASKTATTAPAQKSAAALRVVGA